MGPPHPILDHVLREMQRQGLKRGGPWHLGAPMPVIERDDADRIGAFLLERSVTRREALHPESLRVLRVLEQPQGSWEARLVVNPVAVSNALAESARRPGLLDDGLATARALVDLAGTRAPATWSRPLEIAAEVTASHIASRGGDLAGFAREVDALLMRVEVEGVLRKSGSALQFERLPWRWAGGPGHVCEWWLVETGGAYAAISRAGAVHPGSLDDTLATLPEQAFRSAAEVLTGRK